MTRLTSKGIGIVKIGDHPYINILPKSEIMKRRVQMQDTGDELTIVTSLYYYSCFVQSSSNHFQPVKKKS